METKICSKCQTEKFLSDFTSTPNNAGPKGKGVSSWCRRCSADHINARRKADPEKFRARNQEWTKNNPDYQRTYDLKRHYGFTPELYDALLVDQGNRCAICPATEPGAGHRYFFVDHKHFSLKIWKEMPPEEKRKHVRGLLCHACNTMLTEQLERYFEGVNLYLMKFKDSVI
jgi:hypothetical protein